MDEEDTKRHTTMDAGITHLLAGSAGLERCLPYLLSNLSTVSSIYLFTGSGTTLAAR
jgi:hypothetical protein